MGEGNKPCLETRSAHVRQEYHPVDATRVDAIQRAQGKEEAHKHVSKFERDDRITINKAFTDYDGKIWAQGLELVYAEQSYFPYEGGYTLIFNKGVMRIAEIVDEHQVVIRNEGEAYFRVVRE